VRRRQDPSWSLQRINEARRRQDPSSLQRIKQRCLRNTMCQHSVGDVGGGVPVEDSGHVEDGGPILRIIRADVPAGSWGGVCDGAQEGWGSLVVRRVCVPIACRNQVGEVVEPVPVDLHICQRPKEPIRVVAREANPRGVGSIEVGPHPAVPRGRPAHLKQLPPPVFCAAHGPEGIVVHAKPHGAVALDAPLGGDIVRVPAWVKHPPLKE